MLTKQTAPRQEFDGPVTQRHQTRETFKQLEDHFNAFIAPLLDEDNPEDLGISWEFKKFLHEKKLKLLTAENEGRKKWKESLLSK